MFSSLKATFLLFLAYSSMCLGQSVCFKDTGQTVAFTFQAGVKANSGPGTVPISVDTIWNSDSSWYDVNGLLQQRSSRDFRISFTVPQDTSVFVQCSLSISLDSGKTWNASPNPLRILGTDAAYAGMFFQCGRKGTVTARVFGQDRPNVVFRITALCTLPPVFGLFERTRMSVTPPNATVQLIAWSNTCSIDSTDSLGENGASHAIAITAGNVGWGGFGWANFPGGALVGVDMSAYANCTLHVSAKSTVATDFVMNVENYTHSAQNWISASSVGFLGDGKWHDLVLPLSAWAATCDLSNVDYFLEVSMAPFVTGEILTMDNVFWTLPPSMTSASLIRKKTSASGFRLNVTSNKIVVSLPNSSNELFAVEIFNTAGRNIYSARHDARYGILNISRSRLSTGMYFLSISGCNTKLTSSFFVIK